MKQSILFFILGLILVSTPATARDASIVLCFPGGPGSTADAQPVVDRFVAELSKEMGWKDAKGIYLNILSACRNAYKDHAPTLVMASLDLYLSIKKGWSLKPLVQLNNKSTSGSFHIITKVPDCKDCLNGQTVVTGLKMSEKFLSKVAFDGKINVGKDFTLKRTRSPIRAIKSVVRGKAVAAIVNDTQRV